ncbi:hypothetical protein BH23ACT12_BH23ACT12_13970 [soil metagenome]
MDEDEQQPTDRRNRYTWDADDIVILKRVPMSAHNRGLLATPPPTGFPQAEEEPDHG